MSDREALEKIVAITPPAKEVGNGTAYEMWKQTHDIAKEALRRPQPVSGVPSVEEIRKAFYSVGDFDPYVKKERFEAIHDLIQQSAVQPVSREAISDLFMEWSRGETRFSLVDAIMELITPPADGGWVAVTERLPDAGSREIDHGICAGCGQKLAPNEIESYGSQWCHVVAVADSHGDPAPELCGPVHRFTDADALPPPPADKGKGE